jgi:hypothetical protein
MIEVKASIDGIEYLIQMNGDAVLISSIADNGRPFVALQGKWTEAGQISSRSPLRMDIVQKLEAALREKLGEQPEARTLDIWTPMQVCGCELSHFDHPRTGELICGDECECHSSYEDPIEDVRLEDIAFDEVLSYYESETEDLYCELGGEG